MNEFIERQTNLLTRKECDDLINWPLNTRSMRTPSQENITGYRYVSYNPNEVIQLPELYPIKRSIIQLKNSYTRKYSELNDLPEWKLDYVSIKWWKPGDHYSMWHSEHYPLSMGRILSFLIYLSDNDSYTHFKRHDSIKSELGSGIIFPAYFTHTHKGSICEKGLDRFIASGYFSFLTPNGNS